MADIEELLAALAQQEDEPAPTYAPTPDFDAFVPPADMPAPAPMPEQQPVSSPGGGSFRSDGSFNPYFFDIDTSRGNNGLNRGAEKLAAGLGTVLALFGGERGDAPGAYYKPDLNSVIDYQRTGVDTSAMERGGLPVERVYNVRGAELGERPVTSFGSFAQPVPGRVQATDNARKPLFEADGSIRYADIPGYTSRFGRDLNPTTLENGQRAFYSRNDNLTFAADANRKPDMLLPGGLGYQGGASGGAYGFIPTTMTDGRPVFFHPESKQTFERIGDKLGRPLSGGIGTPADRAQRPMGGGSGSSASGGGYRPNELTDYGAGKNVDVATLGAYEKGTLAEVDGKPNLPTYAGINASGGIKKGDSVKFFGGADNGQMVITRGGREYVYNRQNGAYMGELAYGGQYADGQSASPVSPASPVVSAPAAAPLIASTRPSAPPESPPGTMTTVRSPGLSAQDEIALQGGSSGVTTQNWYGYTTYVDAGGRAVAYVDENGRTVSGAPPSYEERGARGIGGAIASGMQSTARGAGSVIDTAGKYLTANPDAPRAGVPQAVPTAQPNRIVVGRDGNEYLMGPDGNAVATRSNAGQGWKQITGFMDPRGSK